MMLSNNQINLEGKRILNGKMGGVGCKKSATEKTGTSKQTRCHKSTEQCEN